MANESKNMPVLPTLMTLGNAICGLAAIGLVARVLPIRGLEVADAAAHAQKVTEALWGAGILIYIGMLFDMLDGQVARALNQTSRFGVQLDSLCDVITFGVAPSFIMLVFALEVDFVHLRVFNGIAGLFTLCAVLRLARYNVEAEEDTGTGMYFSGIQTPAAAGAIAAFAIAMPKINELAAEESTRQYGQWLLEGVAVGVPVLTFILAALMVSRLPYPHLTKLLVNAAKTESSDNKLAFHHIVQIIFAVILALIMHELAIPLLFCYYILGVPINSLFGRVVKKDESLSQQHQNIVDHS